MPAYLCVTTVPPGEAPLWVREKWVGLTLPLSQPSEAPTHRLTSGVLSGPRNPISGIVALLTGKYQRQSGYAVKSRVAVEILSAHSPEAANWWKENASHLLKPNHNFIFQEGVGHVTSQDLPV